MYYSIPVVTTTYQCETSVMSTLFRNSNEQSISLLSSSVIFTSNFSKLKVLEDPYYKGYKHGVVSSLGVYYSIPVEITT